jgi:hypothetical protein
VKALEYVFRVLGLLVVWVSLAAMVIESGLFIPSDEFETVVAFFALSAAVMATFVVWCGPDLVKNLTRPKTREASAAGDTWGAE